MATRMRAVALALAISAVIAVPGADHEVQQVHGPHVVKHELGPFMEVSKGHKRQASGCVSCNLDGMGSSGYSSGYSTASYGTGAMTRPQTSSSRQEFHSRQQYVNGQPVYQLEHERRYQNGRIVHDKKIEKNEDDPEYSLGSAGAHHRSQSSMTRSGTSGGRYGQDSRYSQHQSHRSRQSFGSSDHGYPSSRSQGQFSGNFEDKVTRMRENLRRQMMSQRVQQPTYGGSKRTEYHSEARYVNGKPVYESERELGYRDGQLVHNRTHENVPEDLGTEDLAQQYDSNGAVISTGSSGGGYYGNRREHQEHSSSTFQNNHNTNPSYPYSQRQNQPSSGYPYRRPTYGTYGSWETSSSYSNNGPTSTSSFDEPASGTSSTSDRENSRQSSSSYPSYTPNSDSSSTTYREDSRQTSYPFRQQTYDRPSTINREESRQSFSSSLYPPHRPTSGSFSTHNTGGRQYSSSSHSPSYPSSSDSSSTNYREEISQSSASYRPNRPIPTTSTPDGLDVTLVQQNTRTPSEDRPSTETFHQTSEPSYNRNAQDVHTQTYRPTGSHRGNRYTETSEEEEDEQYVQRRNEGRGSFSSFQPSVEPSDGGARTVAFDLSSSSSPSGSSFTDHLLQPNHSGRRHDTWDEDDLQHYTIDDTEEQEQRVGIPGVIRGPQTSTDQDDGENKNDEDRYDISPLDDGYTPTIPSVENELESSLIPVPNYDGSAIDSAETDGDRSSDHHNRHRPIHRGPLTSGSSNTYHYSNTHSWNDGEETRHVAPYGNHDRFNNLQTSSYDQSRNHRPTTDNSSYKHNKTHTHTSITGRHQQQQPLPGSFSATSSSCSDEEECATLGVPQSNSRRNETRTTRRYVNGRLVGMTTHERQYINGALVHENRTDHGRDEVVRMNLGDTTNTQVDLTSGTYHPDSYSQQHEFRTEKKFVNGRQVYDLNHERRFEDGTLVYNNRTEKDEDDLREEDQGMGHLGAVTSFSGDTRQQVTQTQHHHQQVNSGSKVDGRMTHIFQDHELGRQSQGSSVPTYSSRRYESRHEQEFVDGQPVYDLQHEQHYQDGSLVHENRTELTEEELARGGHRDALYNILAGDTLTTATQSYGRPAESSESNTHNSGFYNQDSASYEQSRDSYDQTGGSYDQRYGSYDHTSDFQNQNNDASDSIGTSLLTSGSHGSGRATTRFLGGSGTLLTGSDSIRSIPTNNDDSQGSTSRNFHSSISQVQESGGSGSYNQAQGFYGVSADSARSDSRESHSSSSVNSDRGSNDGSSSVTGSDSSQSSSSGYTGGSHGSSSTYESHSSTSQGHGSRGSGCLTCVLMRGGHPDSSSYYGSSGSVGRGAGEHSQRREMNMEEHYENGQLIQGHHASREFRDGQLVHENTRSYPDIAESQASRADALGSHSSSSSSSSSSVSSRSGSAGEDVCIPSPCQNGGTCLAGLYSPICTCSFGFSGRVCEEAECPRGYCRRGGQCSIKGGHHVCTCRPGFAGPRCQDRTHKRSRRYITNP